MRPDEQPALPVQWPDHGTKSTPGGVGRLEEGEDMQASDTGEMSGLSAEEAAMHLEPPPDESELDDV